jgi:thiosulfate dehydrogenase [quinone] large subunit
MTTSEHVVTTKNGEVISNPPIIRRLFNDTRFAPLWLLIRVFLGLAWIQSALPKLSNPAWMQTGEALKGFWAKAVEVPAPPARPVIAFDWYRNFIQGMLDNGSYVWFAKLVAVGELLVGLMLVLGAFVGIAAFIAAFMNWNYVMAGSASTNGLLLIAAIVLVLAWKTAGYYGLDRWLLPLIGTPWRSRRVQRSEPNSADANRQWNLPA